VQTHVSHDFFSAGFAVSLIVSSFAFHADGWESLRTFARAAVSGPAVIESGDRARSGFDAFPYVAPGVVGSGSESTVSIGALKTGGILALVTSQFTLDQQRDHRAESVAVDVSGKKFWKKF
jgi:hypothetical protein